MKIGAIIDYDVTAGGGINQALNAILQMARLVEGRHEFAVFSCMADNVAYLKKLGVEGHLFTSGWRDKLISMSALIEPGRRLQRRFQLVGELERGLIAHNVDLVYFVTPTSRCMVLQKLNYIMTVWDLAHRDTPEFPEVREFQTFFTRERLYQYCLGPALLVLADSDALMAKMASRYGLDPERVLAMPFSSAPFTDKRLAADTSSVQNKYGLEGGYFFYPAQFWPHKNHVRVVQALAMLRDRGMDARVDFAGSNQGNQEHVRARAAELKVEDRVTFLGFVPAEDMRGLYRGCRAVVMPTYFGPTNLPPLEAWGLGKPLIYSEHLSGQAGDAALLVDPDDPVALADAMQAVHDPDVAQGLVERGYQRLREMDRMRDEAEAQLSQRLERFDRRRQCWGVV